MPTRKQARANNKSLVEELKKDKPCVDCGNVFPTICMDFHHIESEKKDNSISRLIKDGYGMKRIQQEIDKCVLVCANCHRIRHLQPLNN